MANAPHHGRFIWHELLTSDPDAAQAFYQEVVGWSAEPYADNSMDYRLWKSGTKSVGGLMKLPAEAASMGAPPHWVGYSGAENADATVAKATSLGAKELIPLMDVPNVGRFGYLQDPQGAVFAVMQPSPSMPSGPFNPPGLHEFSWHELLTADPVAGFEFYKTLFGWVPLTSMDMGPMGVYQIFGLGEEQFGGIMRKPDEMPAPPHWLHYAMVDDADAAAERATKAGGMVVNGPMEVPGGDRIAAIIDPQGAAFAVHAKAK